ncbi:MAG: C25 family cysteine peptidase [Planctomycetota bacterium]
MNKTALSAGLTVAIFSMMSAVSGQTRTYPVSFGPERTPGPLLVTRATVDGTTLTMSGGGLEGRVVKLRQGRFLELDRPTGTTTQIGSPALPVISALLEVPFGAHDFQVTILSEEWTEHDLSEFCDADYLMPCQPPLVKLPGASANARTHFDRAAYTRDAFTPEDTVLVEEAGIMREHRLIRVAVHPLQYNPVAHRVRILSQMVLNVTHRGGDKKATGQLQERYASPFLDRILANRVANHGAASQPLKRPGSGLKSRTLSTPIGYLIVVHDSLTSAIQPLADWKTHVGYDVTVAPTSTAGTTAAQIKSYIETAYNTWPVPPQFVLLVGDSGLIPGFQGSETYSITDLDYTLMNVGDYFPDLFIGRLSATNTTQLQNVLNKVLYYEQLASVSQPWIKDAAFMASTDNYQISEGTHNFVINNYLNPAGYTSDKLYTVSYGATTADVSNSLNAGRSLAVYSGHGSETSWADGPPFGQSNINALTNSNEYPIICSHACLTGDYEYAECFGETWQRAAGKGGVMFWGASTYSYWDEDDILEKGMFEACYADGIPFITGMTNEGLLTLFSHYGGSGLSKYYFQEYNVLGEPSMLLRTEQPVIPVVTHDAALPVGSAVLSVTVLAGGSPVEGALVHAAKGSEVFVSAMTDTTGSISLPVNTITPGSLDLVVTGQNLVVYEASVSVFVPSGPYVILDGYTVNDTVGGNGDGNIDIGETIELPISATNIGLSPALGVTATLTTLDPMIVITDNTEILGDIASGATAFSPDDFDFTVSPSCEDGRLVPFTVTFTDSGTGSWSNTLYLTVNAPKTVFESHQVTELTGNHDGILDPGETVCFGVTLRNDGHHVAENVSVQLHTSSPYCNITAGSSSYSSLLPGASGSNNTPLTAALAIGAPVTNVVVNVDIYRGTDLVGTDQFTFEIGETPILIIDLDPTHNSAPAIEASMTANGMSYDSTLSWPSNLSDYRALFICLGIYSDNTVLDTTQANALVAFMQGGGCVYMEGGDCWAYDSNRAIYSGAFGISGTDDGTSDTGTILGQSGTIAAGLSLSYTGDNNWMDHLSALPGATLIFRNQSPVYGNGVARDTKTHRSIGVSFEFGGIADGPGGTKDQWMGTILRYFSARWRPISRTR